MNHLSAFDTKSNNCAANIISFLTTIDSIYSIYIIQQPDPEPCVIGFISDVNM